MSDNTVIAVFLSHLFLELVQRHARSGSKHAVQEVIGRRCLRQHLLMLAVPLLATAALCWFVCWCEAGGGGGLEMVAGV